MWLFTEKGFLSVVAYDPTKDRHNKRSKRQLKSFGPRPVLVRARREEHLEQLKPFWSKLRIEKDEYADYTFRAVMPRTRWVEFLADAGDQIDYGSHFKEVVKDRCPGSKAAVGKLYSAMLGVWSKLAEIQPYAPYGGYGTKSWGTGTGVGGGYGSVYSTKGTSGTSAGGGFTNYGGQTFRSSPVGSTGYTAPKSAADSASVFMGGTGFGGRFSEGSSLAAKAEAPTSVTELAVKMLTTEPDEIFVEPSESAMTLFHEEVLAQYGRKISAHECATVLNDLLNEPDCPQSDQDEFYIAYDHLLLNFEMPELDDEEAADLAAREAARAEGIDLTAPDTLAEAVSLMLTD